MEVTSNCTYGDLGGPYTNQQYFLLFGMIILMTGQKRWVDSTIWT